MKTFHKYKIVTLTIALLFTVSTTAQKYGHLNYGTLLAAMPATITAEASLGAYQKSLVEKSEKMTSDFQKSYNELENKVMGGEITPLELEQGKTALLKEQEKIQAYEREITQLVTKKREELLKPIIQVAEDAIKNVAKGNGYVMVFDTSIFNAVLFTRDTDDLMPLVKAKLGLN